MIGYAIAAYVIGGVLGVIGTIMIILSLVSASRRGRRFEMRFWAPDHLFMADELALNRRGFILAVFGILVLVASGFLAA